MPDGRVGKLCRGLWVLRKFENKWGMFAVVSGVFGVCVWAAHVSIRSRDIVFGNWIVMPNSVWSWLFSFFVALWKKLGPILSSLVFGR